MASYGYKTKFGSVEMTLLLTWFMTLLKNKVINIYGF